MTSGLYQPIPLVNNRMRSEQLNLDLVVEGERLRLYDPVQGRFLPTPQEAQAQAAAAEARAENAEARADSAEAENERLRAELEALRRQLEERQ